MALARRKVRSEKVEIRVDKRTKRVLAADAARRNTTVSALLLTAWAAYSSGAKLAA